MIDRLYRVESIVPVPHTYAMVTVCLQSTESYGGLTLTGLDLEILAKDLHVNDYVKVAIAKADSPP